MASVNRLGFGLGLWVVLVLVWWWGRDESAASPAADRHPPKLLIHARTTPSGVEITSLGDETWANCKAILNDRFMAAGIGLRPRAPTTVPYGSFLAGNGERFDLLTTGPKSLEVDCPSVLGTTTWVGSF